MAHEYADLTLQYIPVRKRAENKHCAVLPVSDWLRASWCWWCYSPPLGWAPEAWCQTSVWRCQTRSASVARAVADRHPTAHRKTQGAETHTSHIKDFRFPQAVLQDNTLQIDAGLEM